LEIFCGYSNGYTRERVVGRWYVAEKSYQKPTFGAVFAWSDANFRWFSPRVPGARRSARPLQAWRCSRALWRAGRILPGLHLV